MTNLGTSWTNIASGSFSSGGATLTYYIDAKLDSQSTAENKSYISTRARTVFTGYVMGGSGYSMSCTGCTTSSGSGVIYYNNPSYTNARPQVYHTYEKTRLSGSTTVTHGTTGTGKLNMSGGCSNTYLGMNISVSGSIDLPTIPRASKPTYSSDPLTIGQTQTITTNRASNDFTHTLEIAVGEYTEVIENVGASTTWTPATATLMPLMDTWQKDVTVTCTTFNGTTQIGSSTTSFKLQVDTSVYKPVITVGTLSDIGQYTHGLTNGSFIRNKSTLQTSISVESNDVTYGDTVAQASATLGSTTDTEQGGTSALGFVFSAVTTTNVLTVTATDNRGYTVTETVTITLLDYTDISILSVEYARVNANNVETETGEYVRYTIKANAFQGSFGTVTNTIAVTSQSKTASASVYGSSVSEQTVTTSGSGMGEITITGVTVGTYSPSTQYDIIFTLRDALSSATASPLRVHEGVPVYAWGEDHFDVYGELHVHDREDVTKYTTIYPNGYRWNLLGTATGSTAIALDLTNYCEVMLILQYAENTTYTWETSTTIPVAELSTNYLYCMMPARIAPTSASDFGGIVRIKLDSANAFEFVANRASQTPTLKVYAR